MDKGFSKKCLIVFSILIAIIIGLVAFTHYTMSKTNKKIAEIEYLDSINQYNKLYYETTINELKKKNEHLYDSLGIAKDKIDYLVQFTANNQYNTGKVIIKEKHDTIYKDSIKDAQTFEYCNVNPNDTMQYKLQINSTEEPYWYSLYIRTSSKYTIVNKDYGDEINHITIGGNNGNSGITDVTVFKKKKKTFWDRFSLGPGVTAGYDPINKQWGVVIGASATFDLTK